MTRLDLTLPLRDGSGVIALKPLVDVYQLSKTPFVGIL
jgi:hypothetical protein